MRVARPRGRDGQWGIAVGATRICVVTLRGEALPTTVQTNPVELMRMLMFPAVKVAVPAPEPVGVALIVKRGIVAIGPSKIADTPVA